MSSEHVLGDFTLPLDAVNFVGAGLSRPESVLCFRSGDIFASHRPGGVSWIRQNGSIDRLGQANHVTPNGIASLQDGSFLLANHTDAGGVYRLTRDGEVTPYVMEIERLPLPSVNFVYRDHQNRIWLCVSSWRKGDDQYRYNINDGFIALVDRGAAHIVGDGFCWTNECRVDPSGETLYVNETFGRRLTRFRIAPNGDLRDRAIVTEFARDTFPDGLALDVEGGL